MKKFLLIVSFTFISTFAFSQNIINLFGKASDFFALMANDKFDTAHSYFATSEQAKVSPQQLKTIWTSIENKLGKLKEVGGTQSKVQGDFFVVTVAGKFEKDDQNFTVAFNKAEKIMGFFIAPKPIVYSTPSYVDTASFKSTSTYVQSDGHQLAAVVTIPKNSKNFPVVVFVHGSGPGDMDETVGPNKPFKDIAEGLATQGIASIRYVKRTLIYAYEFNKAFTVKEEVTDDALAAIAMAQKIAGADTKNIYLFGHSLGGMLAPKLATLAPTLKGIILAAAPARKLSDIILEQNKYAVELSKDTSATMQKELQNAIVEIDKSKLTTLGNIKPDSLILSLPASYWVDLNNYDQLATAKNLKQRIFVLQGGKDFQVTETDYKLWQNTLQGNKNASLKFYPNINHLLSFQVNKGDMSQYQAPASVLNDVVDDLAKWIKE